jgi:hypothetical protein
LPDRQLFAHLGQRGAEVGQALLLLLDHGRLGLGDEGFVAQLGGGLGDFAFQRAASLPRRAFSAATSIP